MMTYTIALAESRPAESPHTSRPATDAAALRETAKQQLDILNGQDRVLDLGPVAG
jgi:hypothetical protein